MSIVTRSHAKSFMRFDIVVDSRPMSVNLYHSSRRLVKLYCVPRDVGLPFVASRLPYKLTKTQFGSFCNE